MTLSSHHSANQHPPEPHSDCNTTHNPGGKHDGDRAEPLESLGLSDHSPGTILIIDDMPVNLRILMSALKKRGYHISCTIDGQTALNSVEQIMPDLILLDIQMPVMNGYQVCKQLKANPAIADIPVLFISAINTVEEKVQAFEAGGVDYITKPFYVDELLQRVQHQIELRSLQRQLELQNRLLKQEIRDRQAAQENYRAIFENALDGIFQVTPTGRYLSANPALANIYGYDSATDLIASLTDLSTQLYVQPHRRDEFIAYMKRYGQVSDFESQIYRKDGNIIWIAETARVVNDENGNVLYFEGTVRDISERKRMETELIHERQKSERLLLNILPQAVAEQLKQGQAVIAEHFSNVTVLFADIVQFTPLAAALTPTSLVEQLNEIFSTFDQLAEQYNVEKIKTIGDEYMAVCGVPQPHDDHAAAIANMALAMQAAITQFQRTGNTPFSLRIGINTGDVVAGVIGTKKFSYDLWGDAVNMASRMESSGVAGKIQVTSSVYELLRDCYYFSSRGSVAVKGKGEIQTYWLEGKRSPE